MPNTATQTRNKRVEKIERDWPTAADAMATIAKALADGDFFTDEVAAAAKTLEAFGCYVRRTKIGD